MANSRLEEYVETVAVNLKSLPAAEQKQQIDELRQHLESLVAANLAQGENEEIATESAIQQFGNAKEVGSDLGRSVWRMRLKRMPEPVVIALSVAAGMALEMMFFRFGYYPLVQAILPVLPLPRTPYGTVHIVPFWTLPLFFGIAASVLLFYRDGATQTFRRLLNPATVAGAAFYWMVLQTLSMGILNRALSQALIAHNLWDLDSMVAINPVYVVVPPAIAAWIVTRISPRNGITGIAAGLGVSTAIGLAEFVAKQWDFVCSKPSTILMYFGVMPVVMVSICLSASLAAALNRRRHARTS